MIDRWVHTKVKACVLLANGYVQEEGWRNEHIAKLPVAQAGELDQCTIQIIKLKPN